MVAVWTCRFLGSAGATGGAELEDLSYEEEGVEESRDKLGRWKRG